MSDAKDLASLPKHEVVEYDAGPTDNEAGVQEHKIVDANAHISEKVYMFPESYNALRRELDTYYPNLFASVGWPMANDAPTFIEMMDAALDTRTTFDTAKVDSICKKYLNLLRAKRGISAIH